MKKSKILSVEADLALICASAATAQESARLSADFLKQATPLIHWPKGLEPRNADVFVHNEGWIDAPPEIVCLARDASSTRMALKRGSDEPRLRPKRACGRGRSRTRHFH